MIRDALCVMRVILVRTIVESDGSRITLADFTIECADYQDLVEKTKLDGQAPFAIFFRDKRIEAHPKYVVQLDAGYYSLLVENDLIFATFHDFTAISRATELLLIDARLANLTRGVSR